MTAGERTPRQKRLELCGAVSAAAVMSAAALGDVTNAAAAARRRRSCKCLFGAPDRGETLRLAAEQYARDRRRIIRRFNFDIETEAAYKEAPGGTPPAARTPAEALAAPVGSELALPSTPTRRRLPRTPGKRSPHSPRSPRSPRTPTSRRQLHMTDYWSMRKRTESSSSDKEN